VSIWNEDYALASNYIAKAETTPGIEDIPEAMAKVSAAKGLQLLSAKRYARAAARFIGAAPRFPGDFDDVLAPEDICLYGGVLALAHLSRAELRSRVVENSHFQACLELSPAVHGLVHDFFESRYRRCLEALERLRPHMELDVHLHRHCEGLCAGIRDRCMQQYFSTYVSVRFDRMAETFGVTAEEAEKRAADLIGTGKLAARIDSEAQALHASEDDAREAALGEVLKSTSRFLGGSRDMLLHMSVLQGNLGLGRAGSRASPGLPSSALRTLETDAPMDMDVEVSVT